jgi:hypothetical protein
MYTIIHSISMERAETPPRLPDLQNRVHGLHKVRWLERLSHLMVEQGRQAVPGKEAR